MVKGFIFYKESEIPFVIGEDFKMELFSDNPIINEHCKEYNFQYDYILEGKCTVASGVTYTKIVFIIGKSIGTTCYPKCYLIYNSGRSENDKLTMSFESGVLDSVFQYKYKVVDYARQHIDYSLGKKEIYSIPFAAGGNEYLLRYSIGRISDLGLLEDFRRSGESLIELKTTGIQEMYKLFLLMQRFSSFMVSSIPAYFKNIKIYSNQIPVGHFYTNYIKEEYGSEYDIIFHDFDVKRFVPNILNNLSIDLGNTISKSILCMLSPYGRAFRIDMELR